MMLRNHLTKKRFWELVILVFVFVAGFWIWHYVSSEEIVERAVVSLQAAAQKNEALGQGFFFGFALLSAMLSPFSSVPLIPVGVLLWGELTTFLLLFSGWISGGIFAYAVGRFVGYPVVARVVSHERAEAWREYISHRATFLFAFLFRFVMPSETGYIFGIVRYAFWKYFIITAAVEVFFAAVIVWASNAFLADDFIRFVVWVAGILAVSGLAAYALRRNIQT